MAGASRRSPLAWAVLVFGLVQLPTFVTPGLAPTVPRGSSTPVARRAEPEVVDVEATALVKLEEDIEAQIQKAEEEKDQSRLTRLSRLLELKSQVSESMASAISEFVGKDDYDINDVATKVEERVTSAVSKLDNVYLTADAAKNAPEGSKVIILTDVVRPVAGQMKEAGKEAVLAFTGKEDRMGWMVNADKTAAAASIISWWDDSICAAHGAACAGKCQVEAVDSADYENTYGIKAIPGGVKLSFVTGTNVGSCLFLLEDDDTYKLFKLNNREFHLPREGWDDDPQAPRFAVDADSSSVECGMNIAMYFVEMAANGGKGLGENQAGAKFGTGYCCAQCPDIKFINSLANSKDWKPHPKDFSNMGLGHRPVPAVRWIFGPARWQPIPRMRHCGSCVPEAIVVTTTRMAATSTPSGTATAASMGQVLAFSFLETNDCGDWLHNWTYLNNLW
eukprot:s1163_g15.t1